MRTNPALYPLACLAFILSTCAIIYMTFAHTTPRQLRADVRVYTHKAAP